MSTAAEVMLRQQAAQRWLDKAAEQVAREVVKPLTVMLFGRKVHRQRARKLKRRGHLVTRVSPGVYRWMPVPFKFVLPADF